MAGSATGGAMNNGGASSGGVMNNGGASGAGAANGGASGGGAGGQAGTATSGGSAGTAGTAGAANSDGCETETTQETGEWVESMVMVDGDTRPYSVWLPDDYDPTRAYPVIALLHGCTGGTNNVPIERESGADAILFRGTGSAANVCWDSGADGPDVAFFDAMVADVKTRFCADTNRFFAAGYSSGSWLANQLGCIRADVLRGIATVAGGNPGVRNCVGPIAQMFVHDEGDNDNGIEGSESARDRLLTQNNCDESIEPVAEEPSPCVRYQGCDPGYPVVWCATTGEGHNRQDNLAAPAFWNFFMSL
jgi:poly(3-hydroxybutyrate) depolymerase